MSGKNVVNFDAATIAKNAAAAASAPPDAKRPLYREMAPPEHYPLHALGPLRDAAEAIKLRTQAPIEIAAQSVLAAAALAIAPHFDVTLLNGRTGLTMLCLTVAESGERKTSVDNHALAPIYAKEEQLRATYEGQLNSFKADFAAWKAAIEHAKKSAKSGRTAARTAIEAVGAEPKPPPPPMLLIAEATPEGIVMHLAEARPFGGLFSAEGAMMLGGHALSADSKIRTAGLLNTLWDCSPIRRRRVATGAMFLPGRRLSTHLMVQPGVAEILTNDAALVDVGLLARVLIVAPASTAGTRFFRNAPTECAAILASYKERVTEFLDRKPELLDGCVGLNPFVLTLTPDARDMLIAFHDDVEGRMKPDGELSTIKGFASKMAEHAGRIAAVLAAYADPKVTDVTADQMACGIELAQYYGAQMKRLANGAAISPDLKLAQRLLQWWQERPEKRCHLAAIYQRGLNALSDASTARRIVAILEDHGWISRLAPGILLDGKPRREAWELVP